MLALVARPLVRPITVSCLSLWLIPTEHRSFDSVSFVAWNNFPLKARAELVNLSSPPSLSHKSIYKSERRLLPSPWLDNKSSNHNHLTRHTTDLNSCVDFFEHCRQDELSFQFLHQTQRTKCSRSPNESDETSKTYFLQWVTEYQSLFMSKFTRARISPMSLGRTLNRWPLGSDFDMSQSVRSFLWQPFWQDAAIMNKLVHCL